MLPEADSGVTFEDVQGVDEAKGDLEEVVAYLRDPDRFTRLVIPFFLLCV